MIAVYKISVITVCRNSELYIEETINSVLQQTYPHIQYIIVDGASTDKTRDIISKYISKIDHFISEPDTGMYDAINKGLKLADGDYILNLNSDDRLASNDTLEKAVAALQEGPPCEYFYGNIIHDNGPMERKVKVFPVSYKWLLYSQHSTFVPHPCFFISSALNNKLNGYDLRYKYASDYDYILRALKTSDLGGRYINRSVTRFRIHDESISASGKITPERIQVLRTNNYFSIPFVKRKLFYFLVWIYYKLINIGNGYRQKRG